MKNIVFTYILIIACFANASAQTAEVLKSDGISAETQELYELAAQKFEEAVEAYQKQNIVDTACIYHAGINFARIDQHEKAIQYLVKCIALKYNECRSSRLVSDSYVALGDVEMAEDVLLKGNIICPGDEFEFNKKLAYLYFNTGNYDLAVEFFEKLNATEPQNKNFLYLYGFSLERIEKYSDAIMVFEDMQKLFPNDKRAKKMLGISLLEETERLNEIEVKSYERKQNAKIEDYIKTKRKLETINAGFEKARLLLEESLENYPKDKQIIHSLFRIYKKQNKEDLAAKMKAKL